MENEHIEFDFYPHEEQKYKPEGECLYRWIGQCKNCEYDFNPDHHPNNYDCPRYKPIGEFYVKYKLPI